MRINLPVLCVHACLVAGSILSASGNGGGYAYGVNFTAGLAPFEPSGVDQVQILDEKLDIEVGDVSSGVLVRYVMKNVSGKDARVTFGFPIEAAKPWEGPFAARDPAIPWKPTKEELGVVQKAAAEYCYDYSVQVDGDAVKNKTVVEPFATGAIKNFAGSEVLRGLVGWKVSTVKFAEGQERRIKIRYRARHEQSVMAVSNRAGSSAPVFRYRLSTGGAWAGAIAKGRVHVSFVGTDAKWGEIKQPAQRFVRRKVDGQRVFVWEFKDLEPTLADDLEIVAGPDSFEQETEKEDDRWATYYRRGKTWYYRHQNFTAVASSTLPPDGIYWYDAASLRGPDNDDQFGAWSEGVPGDGVGESITLTLKQPARLSALSINPGYGKSMTLFKANGRPKAMTIILNGEHGIQTKIADLWDRHLVPITGYSKLVETVKLVIDEVYPGWEFDDTCISDIELYNHIEGEPKLRGAR